MISEKLLTFLQLELPKGILNQEINVNFFLKGWIFPPSWRSINEDFVFTDSTYI